MLVSQSDTAQLDNPNERDTHENITGITAEASGSFPLVRSRALLRRRTQLLVRPGRGVHGSVRSEHQPSRAIAGGRCQGGYHASRHESRNERLWVRALVLSDDETTAVMVTVDAVAIGEIGPIKNDYLPKVRSQLEQELKIAPASVLINASHCHGVVCDEIEQRTVQAVKEAWQKMVPVRAGVGVGHEDRIMENRRLKLKSGREADVRHAYSLPPDDEVVGVGPIDPEIGVLRLDRQDGQTLAVVYNFACHPIQGVPSGGNTADMTGFASRVIEDNLGDGTIALFLQGCAGDINPVFYKDVDHPRDAEPLGNLLGLSTLKAVRSIASRDGATLRMINETLALPRADLTQRIDALQAEQTRLVQSLKGTSLNLKTFLSADGQVQLGERVSVVLLPPLPARHAAGQGRLAKARRREPPQHGAVHPEHLHHGGTDPGADEPGPAARSIMRRILRPVPGRSTSRWWACASATSCWSRFPAN